jgi:hypothetical protein
MPKTIFRVFGKRSVSTGPKGEKRPRDTNQLAKLMVDILTGEVEDRERTPEERGVDPAASAMGKKGGPARAADLTPERRTEIAKKAAKKRWEK